MRRTLPLRVRILRDFLWGAGLRGDTVICHVVGIAGRASLGESGRARDVVPRALSMPRRVVASTPLSGGGSTCKVAFTQGCRSSFSDKCTLSRGTTFSGSRSLPAGDNENAPFGRLPGANCAQSSGATQVIFLPISPPSEKKK